MNPGASALRLGLTRGWTQFRHLMTTSDGIRDTVLWNAVPLAILILNSGRTSPGTTLPFPVVVMPGILGLMVVAAAWSVTFLLTTEREDGTLLRAKAIPHGMTGYVAGVTVGTVLETAIGMAILLVPSLLLFDGVTIASAGRALTFLGVTLLGLVAMVPFGFAIGSVVTSPRAVGGIGFLLIGALAFVSGIIYPLQDMARWLQVVAQALPSYWVGLGMRSAFLPDAAAAWEVGGSWRPLEMVAVLGLWAVASMALAPVLLRRMARREAGSAMEQRRDQALQRIG